jgi:tetratricopeptide (TPR) repeat protein
LETWLPSVAKEDDRVVVYFAGHGMVLGNQGYLAPYDLAMARLEESGYSMRRLGEVMAGKIKARWKVLLIDACHSGKITPDTTSDALNGAVSSLPMNFLMLTASREQESSFEDASLSTGFGLFSYFLVKGWEGNADVNPRDGIVSADELSEYVRRNVKQYANQKGRMQTPSEKGNFDPKMVLGYAPNVAEVMGVEEIRDGSIVVEVNMENVQVFVDDKPVGRLSKGTTLPLPGLSRGEHIIKGVRAGYDPDTKIINVVPGQRQTVSLRIQFARHLKKSSLDLMDKGLKTYAKRKQDSDIRAAAGIFAQSLKDDERNSKAALYLCLSHQVLGETEEAIKACERAVRTDPDYAEFRLQYAAVLAESGDTNRAIIELQQVLMLEPANSLAYSHLAQAYRMTESAESYQKAIEIATKAIGLQPDNAQAFLWRGDCKRLLHQYSEAEKDYRAYLSIDRFDAPVYEKLAFYLIGFGVTKRNASQKRVYANQQYTAYFGLCECEQQSGNLATARTYCEKALEKQPDDPYTLFLLGSVHRDTFNATKQWSELSEAKRYYSRVLVEFPDLQLATNAERYVTAIEKLLVSKHP